MKLRNRFRGIDSASLCCLAGRYDKQCCRTSPPGWESIPWPLKRFTNTGSGYPGTLNSVKVVKREIFHGYPPSRPRKTWYNHASRFRLLNLSINEVPEYLGPPPRPKKGCEANLLIVELYILSLFFIFTKTAQLQKVAVKFLAHFSTTLILIFFFIFLPTPPHPPPPTLFSIFPLFSLRV